MKKNSIDVMEKLLGYIPVLLAAVLLSCSGEDTLNDISGQDSINTEQEENSSQQPTNDSNIDDSDNTDESDNSGGNTDESTTDEGGASDPKYPTASSDMLSVLFVGNSLTYYNDLPLLLEQEAALQQITIETKMVAYPNYALIDHWDDGDVQKLIQENAYDFVIIQQGPSSQTYGREVLFEYGKLFKNLCDQYNSKLVYFMVWPSRGYYSTFDAVIANHTDAAEANRALLAPVGLEWKKHFDKTEDFSYYGEDGFHPSLKGSKMAAKIIGETLF